LFEGFSPTPQAPTVYLEFCGMLIRIGDPSLVGDLCAHFRRSGFTAEPAGGSTVDVRRPDAPSAEQERREVDLHLRVWKATNPAAEVELLP
jgi:hypothetical protein